MIRNEIRLSVYVFSFNRGQFLENCIQSIEKCAPNLPVTIIDDNSTDLKTQAILADLSNHYEVIGNPSIQKTEKKTGGLYGNMNLAMDLALNDGYEFVIFIQDDMQFVRSFEKQDIHNVYSFFETNQNTIQYVTNFQRCLSSKDFFDKYYIDDSRTAYIRKKRYEKGKSNFGATGVFHVQRFFDVFHRFEVGEGENSQKAKRLGLVKGKSVYPFMCWLPYPISFRGKKRRLLHIFLETFGGAGFHPIDIMSQREADHFLKRNHKEIPLMEKYLKSPSSPRKDVWSTGGGEYNIIAKGGWTAKIWLAIRKLVTKTGV